MVALNQTWARELRNQVLDAYRVSPAPANALFLAKAFGNFLFVTVLEALMAPLFIVFYNLRSVGPPWQLAALGVRRSELPFSQFFRPPAVWSSAFERGRRA